MSRTLRFTCHLCDCTEIDFKTINATLYTEVTIIGDGDIESGTPRVVQGDEIGFECRTNGHPILGSDRRAITDQDELLEWLSEQTYNQQEKTEDAPDNHNPVV